MTRRKRFVLLAAAIGLLGIVGYASYRAGVSGALARSSYVNSMFVRQEHKCLEANDMECMSAGWQIRAQAAAEAARRALQSPMSSAVESELRAYVQWAEALPAYSPPKK